MIYVFGILKRYLNIARERIMTTKVTPPTQAQVRIAREMSNLTQAQAAAVVHAKHYSAWQRWETTGSQHRQMPSATWELFLLKTNLSADLIQNTLEKALERLD